MNAMLVEEDIDLEEDFEIVDISEISKVILNDEQICGFLRKFFDGKEMYYGGYIPDSVLCSQKNINLLLNTPLEQGIAKAYQALEQEVGYDIQVSDSLVADDVKKVLSIMRACARMTIPQGIIPGIVLLYLEYCEGIQFR